MNDLTLLWIIQVAPLVGFLLIQLLPRPLKKSAPFVAILGALIAAIASSILFWTHSSGQGLPNQFVTPWLQVADQSLRLNGTTQNFAFVVGFLLDRLNLWMIWLVTVITFFVQVFSFYYMSEDTSRDRYFGFLSFFAFSMTGLVLSNNLLQTFLFWELVGLTSYLLIGFWFEKPSAATAARKAFVINRLGDLGFYLGIISLFILTGTVSFTDLNGEFLSQVLSERAVTIIGILIFMGVMGKSAQFPFHNWLPDAMEGPTPVSALIHSATMVAAGVFLLARAFPLFNASLQTMQFILIIGSLTAFIGAAMATIQRDIKRILAYSTISQLGLMVMAMGAGSTVAGMFHLSTHAFFKSLLFLTAGAFIHHYHSNDIWEIAKKGGKLDLLPMTALTFGLASLCGLPPFGGFFSKDLILETLKERSLFFYGTALLVSFLTVYYSCRLLFVLLFSKTASQQHGEAHKESTLLKSCEAIPLVSLATLSLIVGFLGSPIDNWILQWLGMEHSSSWNAELLMTTLFLIGGGGALAYFHFRNPETAEKKLAESRSFVLIVLQRKFFVDEAYEFLVKKVGLGMASVLDWFDRQVINKFFVNGTSYNILKIGQWASTLQSGLIQDYISVAMLVGVIVTFWIIL